MPLIFQRFHECKQISLFQFADRPLADDREDVRFEPIHDSVPMLLGKRAHADAMPFSGDIFEAFTLFSSAFFLLFLLLFGRVDAFVEHNLGFFFPCPRVAQADGRIFAEAEQFGLAVEAVAHAPELAAVRRDVEEKPLAVEILARRAGGFHVADKGIRERHLGYSLIFGLSWIKGYPRGQKAFI